MAYNKVFMAGRLFMLGLLVASSTAVAAEQPTSNTLAQSDAVARAAIKPIEASKIILVGDSTTQVGTGWGGAFCAYHVSSFAACVNLARGGRSTFSYRAEGSWDLVLSEIKAAGFERVYVLIQFGHNDQPGKPGRSTDLTTEFPVNLQRYVIEARAAGAIPVLLTPLTRRVFDHNQLQDSLGPWAAATRAVAKENTVPLVDLYATSMQLVAALGPVLSLQLAQVSPPPAVVTAAKTGTTIAAPKSSPVTSTEINSAPERTPPAFDYTHVGEQGARLFAAQVAAELARVIPESASLLRDP